VPALAPAPGAAKTALDRYVDAPDPSYTYELAATIPGEGYTAFVLDMTSQTWRAPGAGASAGTCARTTPVGWQGRTSSRATTSAGTIVD
jgi:hypothetical protein